MPPQLQALMQNRQALIMIGVAGVILLAVLGFVLFGGGGKNSGNPSEQPVPKDQLVLATVNNMGRAVEIQALLAREGLHIKQEAAEGGVYTLSLEEGSKWKDRDQAIITLVQSGLVDKNVGLEAFEKGDLTASREEKRIKLIRAQQGELARLIRKIDPIEDAAVAIAIPEQTLFRSEEKPMSASVQVTLPVGTALGRDKVRAITNLMVGSIQGLDANNVSISDTNGHTYNSVLDPGSEIDRKLEEQDNYMRQKVASQLDRLVGAGNYVVTVSTELREAVKETMVQAFDPQNTVVQSKQAFNENLNTTGGPAAGGPTSSLLPNSLNAMVSGGTPGKDYLRNGVEVTYGNSKTQWLETSPIGMVEDISIAVTIDANHFPGMTIPELQQLLAHAASPKVNPERVSIAQSNLPKANVITHSEAPPPAAADLSWLYWAGGAVGFCILMILLLSLRKGDKGSDEEFVRAQQELAQLREFATQQQAQLQATQQQTQMLLEAQQRQMQQVQALEASTVTGADRQLTQGSGLQQTLDELREAVSGDELAPENLDLQIKTWIESS